MMRDTLFPVILCHFLLTGFIIGAYGEQQEALKINMPDMRYGPDLDGNIRLVGIIQNPNDVTVIIKNFDLDVVMDSGVVLDGKGTLFRTTLLPNQTSSFHFIVPSSEILKLSKSSSISSFNWNQESEVTSPKPQNLAVISHKETRSTNSYVVIGEIKNQGSSPTHNVLVIVSFYDSDGKILDAAGVLTVPSFLDPGQTAKFEVSPNYIPPHQIANYEVTVESEEYTVVPEFPVNLIAITAIGLIGVLVALRFKTIQGQTGSYYKKN